MNFPVNYEFVDERETACEKMSRDLVSYAGKLLELAHSCTLIIGVDDDNKPFVLRCDARLLDAVENVYELV